MKGNISLSEFIHDVKRELIDAQGKSPSEFFELREVELEVAFAVEVDAQGKASFVVFEAKAGTKSSQTHTVKLKLAPLQTARVHKEIPSTGIALDVIQRLSPTVAYDHGGVRYINDNDPIT